MWLWEDNALIANWQEHASYLLELAERWGWKPAFWVVHPNERHDFSEIIERPMEGAEGPYYFAQAVVLTREIDSQEKAQ